MVLAALLATLGVAALLAVVTAVRHRDRTPEPTARPLEDVVLDVRRLGLRFHALHPRTPFTKVQAVCGAYDRALAECCAALGIDHLLTVLPDGPEHDAERRRVEDALTGAGVRLPHAA